MPQQQRTLLVLSLGNRPQKFRIDRIVLTSYSQSHLAVELQPSGSTKSLIFQPDVQNPACTGNFIS
jgi:hypothetical protein